MIIAAVRSLRLTDFSVNHQQDESAQESLLRHGYSKDFRPDLLQYRQLLATLDERGNAVDQRHPRRKWSR